MFSVAAHFNLYQSQRGYSLCVWVMLCSLCSLYETLAFLSLEVFALLDTGSTSTFITERLTSRLGLDRTQMLCKVNTLNGSNNTIASVVSLNISPLGGETPYPLKGVLVVPQIPARFPSSSDRVRSPLMSSVPIKLMSSQAEVEPAHAPRG